MIESGNYTYISHVPNKSCGCIIQLDHNKTGASIRIPITDCKLMFGKTIGQINSEIRSVKPDKTKVEEYVKNNLVAKVSQKINTERFKLNGITSYIDGLCVTIDLDTLDNETVQAINSALHYSGLRPRPSTNNQQISFGC